MAKRKKVSFWATRKTPRKVKIRFRTGIGEMVSFTATKRIPQKVKVQFWASKPGKRIKRRKR